MMDIDEKIKCFREAFEIARKGRPLIRKHIEVFKKLKRFLDDDIVDGIESFTPDNKGILLIGGDFDLLSGATSYIWYRHKLQYLMSGDKIIREGNIQLTTPPLIDNDFRGYNNEEEIRTSLFAQPDGLINKHKFRTVLFLRDVNTKHTEMLERIGRAVRDFKFYSILETEPLLYTTYRDSKKFLYRVSAPSIVVMNVKSADELPEEFSQQFEIIKLNGEEEKEDVIHSTEKDKDKDSTSPNLNDNIFRYKDGRWEIAFDGKTIFPPTATEGFRYISYVLSNPKNDLHNYRIYQSVKTLELGLVTEGQRFDAKLYPESSTKIQTTEEDRGKDYQNYKNMIDSTDKEDAELKKEKSELEIDNIDMSRLEEIEERLNQITATRKLIAKDFKSDGKAKSENEKTASRVYMNIYRCLQLIENEHPLLRNHLKAFFTPGKEFTSYYPDRDIPWQTNYS